MADGSENESCPLEDLHRSFVQFKQDNASSDLVVVAAHRCVDDGELKSMTAAFLDSDNEEVLRFVGWELISLLSKSKGLEEEKHCTLLLDTIAEICSPKEVCLGIVEHMDTALPTQSFTTLLSPLQKALSKLKGKRSKFLRMILPKISRHMKSMELEDNNDEQTREQDNSSSRPGLYSVLDKVMGLLDFLVQDASRLETQTDKPDDPEKDSQSWELVKCLIAILEILAAENLSTNATGNKSHTISYRDDAVKIAGLLGDLQYSAVRLTEYILEHSNSSVNKHDSATKNTAADVDDQEDEPEFEHEDENLPPLGVACYSYLSFAQDAGYIPQVFRHDYLLKINLEGISCLLQRSHPQINYKGIELLSYLTERIDKGSLGHHYLRFKGFLDIPKALINIMVYSSSQEIRIKATSLLQYLIAKLGTQGRYILLRYLLLDCTHAGVAALLIQTIKEEVHCNLNSQGDKNTWFKGKQLISLLHQVCKLPRGVGPEADIVPETERMMATLNCLRYILLRDKEDETTLWDNFSMIEKDFLDPLRECIKLTRLRYLAVQKQNEEDAEKRGKREEKEKKADFTVTTPDGTPISAMSHEDQIQVLRSGLYALDMMDCINAHIADIVSNKR